MLGEWKTYLILGYGADLAAQEQDDLAAKAAAGWGGDYYQAYYTDSSDEIVLAAHWVWDSQADAKEFNLSFTEYLDKRFRGSKLESSDSNCWQSPEQTTCLLEHSKESLWIIAPDLGMIEQIVPLYTSFTMS